MDSIFDSKVQDAFAKACSPTLRQVTVGGKQVSVPVPYPSPVDWRDAWIYFIMVDRFNNPLKPPRHPPYDAYCDGFQGGTINGIREKLDYIRELGAGAIWITPVVMLCPNQPGGYHGYGFQNLLRIDPSFGTEQDLQDLVDAAHARGLRIILDVVLNHAGDVFAYEVDGKLVPKADFSQTKYPIRWRNADATPNPGWSEAPADCPPGAAVGPSELRQNDYFRRQGVGGEGGGDFESLKELVTDSGVDDPDSGWQKPVPNILIRAYQYLIARYDVDGLRIDTLKYVEEDFARTFGNAMREYASAIGKKNFFTFGEIWKGKDDETIKKYIGISVQDVNGVTGVDAALDFPLFHMLQGVLKGPASPRALADFYETRKTVYAGQMSSHGEASRYFVTFLDNHDQNCRFHYCPPHDPKAYDNQLTMAVGLLFSLQGIPCLYYGTEQGLCGMGNADKYVREALWGKPGGFDTTHPFFEAIAGLAKLRDSQPALRYGRQYFRPVSGDGVHLGVSPYPGGVIALSRLLTDTEVLVVANTSPQQTWRGEILVDYALNASKSGPWKALFSNQRQPAAVPVGLQQKAKSGCSIDGRTIDAALRTVRTEVLPLELLILGK